MAVNNAEPRWMTPRTPGRKTIGHEVCRIAEALGFEFMPWQQHWVLVCGEVVEDPETGSTIPAYQECFDTVMRQQGKTLKTVAQYLHRALLWPSFDGRPANIAFSGQTGSLARAKFQEEHYPLLRSSALWSKIKRARFAAERSGLDFKNGALMTIWASSAGSGHSLTIDMAIMDEIWADIDARREQAAVPAMATRHDRQKLMSSTGGTEASVLYLRKQKNGRAAVEAGRREGIAYLEFSADDALESFDPTDPRLWRQVMPALGYTITERTVRAALDEMVGEDGNLDEFKRAWLNITNRRGGASVIDPVLWAKVKDRDAAPVGVLVLGVDAQPGQESASVVACDDRLHVELIDSRVGTSWLLDRIVQVALDADAEVVVDVGGPVGFLVDQLELAGVRVFRAGTRDVMHATQAFMDRLAAHHLHVRPHLKLDGAAKDGVKRKVGEGWMWARKTLDTDISPLVAATLAVGRQMSKPVTSVASPIFYVPGGSKR